MKIILYFVATLFILVAFIPNKLWFEMLISKNDIFREIAYNSRFLHKNIEYTPIGGESMTLGFLSEYMMEAKRKNNREAYENTWESFCYIYFNQNSENITKEAGNLFANSVFIHNIDMLKFLSINRIVDENTSITVNPDSIKETNLFEFLQSDNIWLNLDAEQKKYINNYLNNSSNTEGEYYCK